MTDITQRQLDLLQVLDKIRDSYGDDDEPSAMFTAICRLLVHSLAADTCGILLLSEEGPGIECAAGAGLDTEQVLEFGQQALEFDQWETLDPSSNMLATAIGLNNTRLGAMVLARAERAFDADEQILLDLAESQIDSAVIQARTIWKYRQRNRELQAIHEIDQLRDYTHYETDLISGFSSLLIKYFQAELCILILSHADSGELVVRGIIDRSALPAAALDAISAAVKAIDNVQELPITLQQLKLLAAPLVVQRSRLGGVVLGRQADFRAPDYRLLDAMTAQMDSAIVYSRVHQQLAQRKQELEVIYRIDRIRDQETDFDTLLQRVLHELCTAIAGEMGYIMLYSDREEQVLELISSTVTNISQVAEVIDSFSRQTLANGHLTYDNQIHTDGVRSILAVPLILNQKVIGVFGAINSQNSRGFSAEDRRLLSAITSQVDTAIFERLEQRRIRGLLSRSVDPKVLNRMLQQANASQLLAGERVVISVIYADLRGSTAWAERTPPENLVATLNQYLGKMTDVIFKHGGTLDKFVGDEVIGLFGSPIYMPDHAARAAAAALEMQTVHVHLTAELAAQGHELPPMGVGVSSGEVITGEIGPPIRTDFTAVGQAMNLGARLCSAAGPGQIYISHATYTLIQSDCRVNTLEPLRLKGISQPAPVYELLEFPC